MSARNQSMRANVDDIPPPFLAHDPAIAPVEPKHNQPDSEDPTPELSAPSAPPAPPPPEPSLRLLFSLLSRRHVFLILLPAILSSMIAGGLAPFMTFVVGQAFDAFARFALDPDPSQEARKILLRDVGLVALQLIGLAVGSVALGSVMSSLWIWTGELNTMAVRKAVFDAVSRKEMAWFDSYDAALNSDSASNDSERVGAGGLLAKFTRQTEDIRSASSLAPGHIVQHLTTVIACLVLAFIRSYQLTFIVLASVPILMVIQGIAQGTSAPGLAHERQKTAETSTVVERSIAFISTVKAFNAERHELTRAGRYFEVLRLAARRLNTTWAFTSGSAQFVTMAMFVQAFWFGGKLVRDGRASAGEIMAVFWACLMATTNLQLCVPHSLTMTKGKSAIADLLEVVINDPKNKPLPSRPSTSDETSPFDRLRRSLEKPQPSSSSPASSAPSSYNQRDRAISHPSPISPNSRRHRHAATTPTSNQAPLLPPPPSATSPPPSISLHNVTLYYPSRPTVPALSNITLHLSSGKTTFVVGSSGSGKSTIAALLLGWYPPSNGYLKVSGKEVDVRTRNYKEWVAREVCCVGQAGGAGTVVLEGRTVLENVAAAAAFAFQPLATTASSSSAEDVDPGWDANGRYSLVPPSTAVGELGELNPSAGPSAHFRPISRKRVKEACQAALMHEFVRDLPQGYETRLSSGAGGEEGLSLSGGQKQRLALARAWIRDPAVLILDEATSALDPTSRLLIFEALRVWRQGKTTIVITHDLAQIQPNDFAYVLKEGRLVERGYRRELEQGYGRRYKDYGSGSGRGEFRRMLDSQKEMGGWLPEKDISPVISPKGSLESIVAQAEAESNQNRGDAGPGFNNLKHQSFAVRPLPSLGVLLASRSSASFSPGLRAGHQAGSLSSKSSAVGLDNKYTNQWKHWSHQHHHSKPVLDEKHAKHQSQQPYLHYRYQQQYQQHLQPTITFDDRTRYHGTADSRRFSLPSSTPGAAAVASLSVNIKPRWVEEEEEFNNEKDMIKRSGFTAQGGRRHFDRTRRSQDANGPHSSPNPNSNYPNGPPSTIPPHSGPQNHSLFSIIRLVFPTIPHKPLFFLGLLVCIASGAMTPLFSFFLARLLFEVSSGAHNMRIINMFGAIVLATAAADGFLIGAKYWLMETSAMYWVSHMRKATMTRILLQDRKFFDDPEHAPPKIVQLLVKDADDARDLIAIVLGQLVVVVVMLGTGLTWAMVRGWQLTLAGIAVAPVFAVVMVIQARLVTICDSRGRKAREKVARGYYDVLINIRSIRCMSLQPFFDIQFASAAEKALVAGVQGALIEGCTFGVASGLIYLAEAVLFYVGAVLLGKGIYTYSQMLEVLNLVVFTVTIGSQLLAFTEKTAKATNAGLAFYKLATLSTSTTESQGTLRPPLMGPIAFDHVHFAYPHCPDIPVLRDATFLVHPGESVAIVGSSGCGKSTIAALLQRLYDPTSGSITFGPYVLSALDVHHLRDHIAVVSQHPHLFDASIRDNIRYGAFEISDAQIEDAARAANIHDFICGLPNGYDTHVGENAALISGGQAQRIQIARALTRRVRLLILDEFTSALDPENQTAILETVMRIKEEQGLSVMMITHKVPLMRVCDRVLVMENGRFEEEGSYEDLMRHDGVFRRLANAGEWVW